MGYTEKRETSIQKVYQRLLQETEAYVLYVMKTFCIVVVQSWSPAKNLNIQQQRQAHREKRVVSQISLHIQSPGLQDYSEVWNLKIFRLGGGVFWVTWNLDLGKKTKVFNFWEGGILGNMKFGLRKEN